MNSIRGARYVGLSPKLSISVSNITLVSGLPMFAVFTDESIVTIPSFCHGFVALGTVDSVRIRLIGEFDIWWRGGLGGLWFVEEVV